MARVPGTMETYSSPFLKKVYPSVNPIEFKRNDSGVMVCLLFIILSGIPLKSRAGGIEHEQGSLGELCPKLLLY